MIKILIIIFIFAISGCARIHKIESSSFESFPSKPPQQFKFIAHTNIWNPYGDGDGEKTRMEWLQMWIDDSDICKNGYVIVERKEADIGLGPEVKRIYYTGQCK